MLATRPLAAFTLAGDSIPAPPPPSPPPPPPTVSLLVRERPPTRIRWMIETPAGRLARWGADDPRPGNAPETVTFSTTMPGGFENFSCVLERDPRRSYPDLEELSTITGIGAVGGVAWQGRIEQLPDTAGTQAQVSPQAVGWQSHLQDDDSAREIFVDRNITAWQGPSVARQIQWLQNPDSAVVASGPSVAPDFTNGYPSLACELQGSWTQDQVVEGWYDAHGQPLGLLYAAWQTNGAFTLTGGDAFGAALFLCTDDTGVSYDSLNPINSAPGQGTLYSTGGREWALVQFWNDTVPGGQDGVTYSLFFTALGVYGAHGLPLHGPEDQTDAPGVLASDGIAYAVGRWAPKLAYTLGPGGTIRPSAFIIPQWVYLDPTTVSQMITDGTQYELLDWAVWEGQAGSIPPPTFYMNPRGQRGRQWVARTGPAQLQEAGPQISHLWNGVLVQFTDTTGENRTVGPPGSGANQEDVSLVDSDPQNPANQAGIRRWALVTIGTSTFAGALQIGQAFLGEQRLLNTSGQAALVGHVQDSTGAWWPAWCVRGGDFISFLDSSDPSARRVISTSYDETSKTNTVTLDQPPDSLQALLERFSSFISVVGLS